MSSLEGYTAFAHRYIGELQGILRVLPLDPLARVLEALETAQHAGKTVFLAGNGGSAATASHMASDLMRGARKSGKGFKAISLSDNASLVTAIANDDGYEHVFAGQLRALAQVGDVLLLISGSGNSPNVLRAAEVAQELRLRTIGFLGRDGGKLRKLLDIAVIVPSEDYGPIEDIHLIFNHLITAYFCDTKLQ